MDSLHHMKVFVAVAEAQGFAPAARQLGISPPAVTRAVAALEDQLGAKLLNRTTRHVRMTEAGERYLQDAKKILQDVQAANNAAAGVNTNPIGHLAVTAPVMFGRMFVMPTVLKYLEEYPDTTVDAIFLDRVVNLLEEGLDVGVRIGPLPDSSMRATKVGSVRLICCASPGYLKDHGIPQTPDDLERHRLVHSMAVSGTPLWKFEKDGQQFPTRISPKLSVTSNAAAIEAALAGFGITRLLSYQVAPHLNSGAQKIVLEDYEPETKPIHIVHREGYLATAKVRAFIDMIAADLRADKSLN
jgi:DNA-binding transcriptional LysR family regulator